MLVVWTRLEESFELSSRKEWRQIGGTAGINAVTSLGSVCLGCGGLIERDRSV